MTGVNWSKFWLPLKGHAPLYPYPTSPLPCVSSSVDRMWSGKLGTDPAKNLPSKDKMVPHWPGEAASCLLKQERCPAAAFPELLVGFLYVTLRLLELIKAFGLSKSVIWWTVASPRSFFLQSKFFSPLHCWNYTALVSLVVWVPIFFTLLMGDSSKAHWKQ